MAEEKKPEVLASLSLSAEEQKIVDLLITLNQTHLFKEWTTNDDDKEKRSEFFKQMKIIDASYPGGLTAYIASAKVLLAASARGDNPLEGWVPSVPTGESLRFGSEEWDSFEKLGLQEASKCAFVLVAGGLGERLGYSRIKVELPTETLTKTTYLKYYVETILSVQKKTKAKCPLPLAIMVSDDTEKMTREMLAENNNFGAAPKQITLLKQEKVAALQDNDAAIAPDGPYKIQAKPHGHGDVHVLLHQSNLVKDWALKQKLEWVYFFQDTNGLGFRPLYATLGVSRKLDLHCNFLTVPRLPGQAVGGIAKLENKTENKKMVINVEYNQLDPLLRATVNPKGDVAGADGIHSPYPGNINQFVLKCKPYAETLEKTQGVMGEFVNPKYADASKTKFKKPARLECMMQDYPKVLDASEKVGFTAVESWIAFSPCKNATSDATSKNPPACALSAESDQYYHCAQMLRTLGCAVADGGAETWDGVTYDKGLSPAIVLSPSVAVGLLELKQKVPAPQFITISATSSLYLSGDITLRSLILDGHLSVKAPPNASVEIVECVCKNSGVTRVAPPADAPESLKIRGYDTVFGDDVVDITITAPGKWLVTCSGETPGKVVAVKKQDAMPCALF